MVSQQKRPTSHKSGRRSKLRDPEPVMPNLAGRPECSFIASSEGLKQRYSCGRYRHSHRARPVEERRRAGGSIMEYT
eukprot:scaffold158284_cov35-Tisochrysis_lutea.AAC.2